MDPVPPTHRARGRETMGEARKMPVAGEVWNRRKDDKAVTIVESGPYPYGFVKLLWPSGRHTEKRIHYFLYEFTPPEVT